MTTTSSLPHPPPSRCLPPSLSLSTPVSLPLALFFSCSLASSCLSLFILVYFYRGCVEYSLQTTVWSLSASLPFSRLPLLARARCLSFALFFSFSLFRSFLFSSLFSLLRVVPLVLSPCLESSLSISRTHSLSLAYPLTLLSLALSLFPPRTSRFYK